MVLEQEAVDAYYGGGPYAPAYPPEAVEYMPPVYLPPPPAPAPLPHAPMPPHGPPHQPTQPHQFNVHAKNFVAGQSKTYVPHDKPRSPPAAPVVSAAAPLDSLPMKDLKITTKGPVSPKHTDRPMEAPPAKAATSPVEKIQPKADPSKPVWTPPENKIDPGPNPTKTFVPVASSGPTPTSTPTAKLPPTKVTKGPAAPFSGGKQPPKPSTVPASIVPVQQTATTPKPPFGNRQKREGPQPPTHRSPSSENAEIAPRDPPLPPSKAPMPISITLPTGAGGQPLIVANKPPFGHSRRAAPEPAPAPQPPPPAPTASDFPPPPTPRNRGELPPPIVTPQPQPAPGKSWASLFSNKSSSGTTTVAATPTAPVLEEPPSPTSIAPPAVASCQKPVAKVPPYDASPLAQQTPVADKSSPTPRPAPIVSTPPTQTPVPTISYSEKTSVNAVSASVPSASATPVKTPSPTNSEPREVPIQKDSPPQLPVQPSPFSDDPNSYRMGGMTHYKLNF